MQESQVEGAYYRWERPCSVKPSISNKRMAARLMGPWQLMVKRRMRCPSFPYKTWGADFYARAGSMQFTRLYFVDGRIQNISTVGIIIIVFCFHIIHSAHNNDKVHM